MITPLELAKRNLADYLINNPKARKYQDEIDEMLSKVPEKARLETIQLVLAGKLKELGEALCCLLAKKPVV